MLLIAYYRNYAYKCINSNKVKMIHTYLITSPTFLLL